jgi:hypothetical protein
MDVVVVVLTEISEECHADRSLDATGLLNRMNSSFAACLIVFTELLQRIHIVSQFLQTSDLDLSKAADLIENLKSAFQDMRSEKYSCVKF